MLTVLKLVEWMKDVAEIAPTKSYNQKDLLMASLWTDAARSSLKPGLIRLTHFVVERTGLTKTVEGMSNDPVNIRLSKMS